MTSSTVCPQWPVPAQVRAHPVTAAGAPPILVVGTTRDPATPYEWAQAAAAHLVSGRLLTRIGSGHVAYTRSACVTTTVDRYHPRRPARRRRDLHRLIRPGRMAQACPMRMVPIPVPAESRDGPSGSGTTATEILRTKSAVAWMR
jgi:TAP-like protein